MRDGLIKVAAGTPVVRVADCSYNAKSICRLIAQAQHAKANLLVLPELCLTGYTCGDLFGQQMLLEGALEGLKKILKATKESEMLVVAGIPLRVWDKLYNCGAVLCQGEILGVVPKSFLPNYGEFYEKRQFSAAPPENCRIELFSKQVPFGTRLLFTCRQLPKFRLAVEICEDLWSACPPSIAHASAGATVIANLSASDETVGKDQYRRNLVCGQSARLVCGYVYADTGAGESTTDLVFAAHNMIAENGVLLAQSKKFEEGLTVSEIDVQRLSYERQRLTTFPERSDLEYWEIPFSMKLTETALTRKVVSTPFVPGNERDREECCEDILQIQSFGLRKRLEHSRAKTAVVGISGGLDSALALLVCVRAVKLLPPGQVQILAVTMPCFGTSARTKHNAQLLCERLGVTLKEVDITASVQQHFRDIGQADAQYDVTFENAQARERTQVLMDMANQTGGLVVGTGDLSELALGWATYNGDHMSMYGVNASVPKTLVRVLVAYEANRTEDPQLAEALQDILDTPVSPELLPPKEGEIDQKTEDLVGPYELHDFFLYYVIRWGYAPKKVLRFAQYAFGSQYPRQVILYWLRTFYRRFFAQQFKRSCLPDGPKVGSVSLSPRGDWRMPSDAVAALWLSQLDTME